MPKNTEDVENPCYILNCLDSKIELILFHKLFDRIFSVDDFTSSSGDSVYDPLEKTWTYSCKLGTECDMNVEENSSMIDFNFGLELLEGTKIMTAKASTINFKCKYSNLIEVESAVTNLKGFG